MATLASASISIQDLIDWNDDCYDDLENMTTAQAGLEIATALTPISGGSDNTPDLVCDITSVLRGSAIDVIYTIAGHRVEFALDDSDDAIVTVDGEEVARYDASNVG